MKLTRLLDNLRSVFRAQGRLVRLSEADTIVFVGDTHGDLDASERIFARYLKPGTTLVFLGDTIDRGPDSAANLELILQSKRTHPESVYLLMGNHEAWAIQPFCPADFWEQLTSRQEKRIGLALTELPFAAWHPSGVLGVHGALPDLASLEDFEEIALGSETWKAIIWGDWQESPTEAQPIGWEMRPTFGPDAFHSRATRLGVRVLVRSHQPTSPTTQYGARCLTIFTSYAYGDPQRRVALLTPHRSVTSAEDLSLVEI